MEALVRLRPIELLAFGVGALVIVYATVSRDELIFLVGASIGFTGITGFLVTEAFGRLAEARSALSRWTARVFLVPSTLISVSVFYLIGRWSIHNVGG